MPHFKTEKLRVNLRLAINRLKLLEKKKSAFIARVNPRVCSHSWLVGPKKEYTFLARTL